MNGQVPPTGIGWQDPRMVGTRRAEAPLRLAWLASLVAISNSGQVFDLQTGYPVHRPDLISAQLIAASRDASVVAIGRPWRAGLGSFTLFVR